MEARICKAAEARSASVSSAKGSVEETNPRSTATPYTVERLAAQTRPRWRRLVRHQEGEWWMRGRYRWSLLSSKRSRRVRWTKGCLAGEMRERTARPAARGILCLVLSCVTTVRADTPWRWLTDMSACNMNISDALHASNHSVSVMLLLVCCTYAFRVMRGVNLGTPIALCPRHHRP